MKRKKNFLSNQNQFFDCTAKSGSNFKKNLFTLIELLVVISIITVLMSILLPALSRVKDKTNRMVCQNNLNNIGKAVFVYIQDNNDLLPGPCSMGIIILSQFSGNQSLAYLLSPYLGTNDKSWICPAQRDLLSSGYARNYVCNTSNVFGVIGTSPPLRFAALQKKTSGLSSIWLIEDMDNWNFSYATNAPIHSGGRNILFADGHTSWLKTFSAGQVP
jgi:prepilin-type processing-associated H-X9-DG protein/prepilin-type N-terminal cleavage/methylation domain-containing protein